MANADKGNIEVINGSIGDLIFRIETLTSDRDTIKVCVRANNELTAMNKHIDEQAATIARLTAANESMQEDAVQNTCAFNLMLTANKAQAEDIRTLKQELETIKSSKHMHVKIHSRLYRPSTREEPAEYEYKAECKDCGELFSADDVDEWSEVEE